MTVESAALQVVEGILVAVFFLTSSTIHPTSLHPQVG